MKYHVEEEPVETTAVADADATENQTPRKSWRKRLGRTQGKDSDCRWHCLPRLSARRLARRP